jgi:hypothetical protein
MSRRSKPLVIVECPMGHPWYRVHPAYISDNNKFRPRQWCPEHKKEREELRQAAHRKAKDKIARSYSAMGLPKTKKCNGCKKIKKVSVVATESEFYLRRRRRVNGEFSVYPESQCKECHKVRVKAAWASLSSEERLSRSRARNANSDPQNVKMWQATYREKKRQEEGRPRKIFRNTAEDKVRYKISRSFRTYVRQQDLSEIARRAKCDNSTLSKLALGQTRTIENDLADRILLSAGAEYTVDDFWTLDGTPIEILELLQEAA